MSWSANWFTTATSGTYEFSIELSWGAGSMGVSSDALIGLFHHPLQDGILQFPGLR